MSIPLGNQTGKNSKRTLSSLPPISDNVGANVMNTCLNGYKSHTLNFRTNSNNVNGSISISLYDKTSATALTGEIEYSNIYTVNLVDMKQYSGYMTDSFSFGGSSSILPNVNFQLIRIHFILTGSITGFTGSTYFELISNK